MTLYMIGIGLNDEKDISVRGLEIVRKCEFVYLESYTSKLNCGVEKLEEMYGKKIIVANRDMVEKRDEEILDKAEKREVAFLVVGDVFSATTHTSLRLRALEREIKIVIVHNASILTAVGDSGLELYKFGKTTSIPFENENVNAPYDVLEMNHKIGLHTLFLLDIDADSGRYMSVKGALEYLLRVEGERKKGLVNEETLCVGCGNLGSKAKIKTGTAAEIIKEEFPGLQCLVIPGKMHFIEEEALKHNIYK